MNDTVSEDVKLEPCPFCGHEAVHQNHSAKAGEFWYANSFIRCPYCRANGPVGSQDEAVTAWNRRAYLAATKPPLADVTDAIARAQETLNNAKVTGENPTSQRALEYRLGELINILSALASSPMPGRGEGFVLVPVEPTPEMLAAWYRYKSGHHFPDEPPPRDKSDYGAYRAMLAASRPKEDTQQ